MRSKYQTLNQFILSPFYDDASMDKNMKYATRYNSYIQSKSIYVKAITEIEGSWYYHIKVPSEAKEGKVEYDVIIRFFTDKTFIKFENHLKNYYIQFFSNSPGFIYKYAYVYAQRGYLINLLVNKLNPEALTQPPDKSNSDQTLSYDSTIYFACRFLSGQTLSKFAGFGLKKVNPDKFFQGIADFNSVRIENEILNEEKKLQREMKNNTPKGNKVSEAGRILGRSKRIKVTANGKQKKMAKIGPKGKNSKITGKNSTFK